MYDGVNTAAGSDNLEEDLRRRSEGTSLLRGDSSGSSMGLAMQPSEAVRWDNSKSK